MTSWWLLPAAAAMSLVLTGLLRQYAIAHHVMDVPNDRSLHHMATPRGGGVAIAVTFLVGVAVLGAFGRLDRAVAIALVGSGLIVGGIGFVDDHHPIAASWRLAAHFVAASWALAWLGGLPAIEIVGKTVHLGWIGNVLATIGLVWLLNLYNFMDGIDGLAGVEAVTAGAGIAALSLLFSPTAAHWILPGLLAAAAFGFLIWNWPPAKIFLGDAGSGFLGLTLGVLALHAMHLGPTLLWASAILLGAFVVDASVTLVRRVRRGEKSYEAHRSHAYQHAALRLGSHTPVTMAVAAINVLWLFPLALLVAGGWIDGLGGLFIAYASLAWIVFRFEAGRP